MAGRRRPPTPTGSALATQYAEGRRCLHGRIKQDEENGQYVGQACLSWPER
ncbi:Bbp19 family protein [Nonomuraea sp. 3N208]|uniref:Bbp19 family protein n=1 Tax=Nonomuraea sp. 3N208 TaxID=3457421 RepID=UPI003FD2F191